MYMIDIGSMTAETAAGHSDGSPNKGNDTKDRYENGTDN